MIEALELEHLSDFVIRFANSHPFRVRLTKFLHQNWTKVRNAGDFCPFFTSAVYVIIEPKIAPFQISNSPHSEVC